MSIKAIPRHLWEDCDCGNVGWYADCCHNEFDQWQEQVQCEFCYTNPNSVFNQQQLINAGNDEYDEDSLPF